VSEEPVMPETTDPVEEQEEGSSGRSISLWSWFMLIMFSVWAIPRIPSVISRISMPREEAVIWGVTGLYLLFSIVPIVFTILFYIFVGHFLLVFLRYAYRFITAPPDEVTGGGNKE
jgi:hypothetical protein